MINAGVYLSHMPMKLLQLLLESKDYKTKVFIEKLI